MESSRKAGTGGRDALLRALQLNRDGLSAEELATAADITPSAVRQHLAALERDGYVSREVQRKALGRPGYRYQLTTAGEDLFPKRYSWFSSLLLAGMREQFGSEGLAAALRRLASGVAAQVGGRPDQPHAARVETLVAAMNDLGFDANARGPGEIVARNCVYHRLAQEFPEVCEFDLELIGRVTGSEVSHAECMVRGGQVCRFLLREKESQGG